MKHHPDKGGTNATFQLVRSIDYDYGAIYPEPTASMAPAALQFPPQKDEDMWFNQEDTMDARYYRRGFEALKRAGYESLKDPKDVASTCREVTRTFGSTIRKRSSMRYLIYNYVR